LREMARRVKRDKMHDGNALRRRHATGCRWWWRGRCGGVSPPARAGNCELMVCVPDEDEFAEGVEGDPTIQGGAKVVEGVDFGDEVNRRGGERVSDGPGEARWRRRRGVL
jgi:hypothetical protein